MFDLQFMSNTNTSRSLESVKYSRYLKYKQGHWRKAKNVFLSGFMQRHEFILATQVHLRERRELSGVCLPGSRAGTLWTNSGVGKSQVLLGSTHCSKTSNGNAN